jgi:dUTP pyrophosphatase
MHILNFVTNEEFYDEMKTTHEGDSGIDLFFPEEIKIPAGETKLIDLKIKSQMYESSEINQKISYNLRARSSIYKTPLRISNSAGLIDAGYTGNIKVALDNIKNYDYIIKKGQSIVQLVAGDLKPIITRKVLELENTSRGSNGFGSTNK